MIVVVLLWSMKVVRWNFIKIDLVDRVIYVKDEGYKRVYSRNDLTDDDVSPYE